MVAPAQSLRQFGTQTSRLRMFMYSCSRHSNRRARLARHRGATRQLAASLRHDVQHSTAIHDDLHRCCMAQGDRLLVKPCSLVWRACDVLMQALQARACTGHWLHALADSRPFKTRPTIRKALSRTCRLILGLKDLTWCCACVDSCSCTAGLPRKQAERASSTHGISCHTRLAATMATPANAQLTKNVAIAQCRKAISSGDKTLNVQSHDVPRRA